MERCIGDNAHLSYISDEHWPVLLSRWQTGNPGALLLLDSFGNDNPTAKAKAMARAALASERLPNTEIVYRLYIRNPHNGTGDHHYQFLTPAEWVDKHRQFAGTRIYCSADNEPNFAASLPWLLAVAKAARAANIRVSLGGWSVGAYEIADIPKLDALLRYTAAHPGWFVYDFHEYTRGSVFVDVAPHEHNPANWPDVVPPQINLWLMGRFRQVLKYCDTMGIKRPQIIIGEFGFDRVHAVESTLYGNVGGLNTLGGLFRSWGFENWQAYAAAQLQAAWRAIYAPYSSVIGACYYQVSDRGSDNWAEFNASDAPTFIDATRKGFGTMTTPDATPVQPTPYAPGSYTLDITNPNVNAINLRSSTGAFISEIVDGEPVDVLSREYKLIRIGRDDYWCQQVRVGGEAGFIARTPSYELKAKTPPTPEPDPRYAALAARCREEAGALREIADELEGIAREAEAMNVRGQVTP